MVNLHLAGRLPGSSHAPAACGDGFVVIVVSEEGEGRDLNADGDFDDDVPLVLVID